MKKSYSFSKTTKIAFLAVNHFFCVRFQNTKQNNICVFIVFKAKSEPKHEEKIFFLGVFLQKPKTRFFRGKHKIILKLTFQICISTFVLFCTRKLCSNFHKKLLIFRPPGLFWKWKLWCTCAGARCACPAILDLDF